MLEETAMVSTSVAGFGSREIGKEMTLIFRKHFAREKEPTDKEHEQRNNSGRYHKAKSIIPSMITIGPSAPSSPLHRGGIDSKHSQDSQDDDNSLHSFQTCLSLLESDYNRNDCRTGMERLIKTVNSELVNFKKEGTIAMALVCGVDLGCRSETERLRKVILACFSENASAFYKRGISSDSSSASDSYENSTLTDSYGCLMDLKLPALRILASSLDLIAMLGPSVHSQVDLSSTFWMLILGSMSEATEVVAESRIEATLSIKCFRLLHQMQPKTMEPFIRYSLLPFLMHAYGFGKEHGDRMLVRETERLLKPLGTIANS